MTGPQRLSGSADTVDESSAIAAAVGPAPLPLVYLGHDLRASLAEMRAGLHMVHALDLPQQAQDTINRCIAAGENLSRLIDQSVLVCLGRAAPGLMAAECIVTADWTQDLRLRLAGLARQNGHDLALETVGPLPDEFAMDRTALDRIVTNLVLNALRHTPRCTVRVSLSLSEGRDGLALRVTDAGPGFPPVILAALTLGGTLRHENSPADRGFGLQSVQYLVSAMGGQSRFGNAVMGGAEVSLTLPFAQECSAPPEPAPTLTPFDRLIGTSILLVEDNATCRAALRALTDQLVMQMVDAGDGGQAIGLLRSGARFDLVVLDDQLPDLTGLEVLNWINTHLPPRDRPPVLVVTSHAEPGRIRTLTRAGACRVLTKPVLDLDRLGKLLVEVMDERAPLPDPSAIQTPGGDDLSSLHRLARMAGPEAAQELFEKLGEDLQTVRTGLADAARNKDIAGIRRHSHVLIALAGTAGAHGLHDDAVRLNGLAHADAPNERLFALAHMLDKATEELHRAVRAMAPKELSVFSPE